MPVIAAFGTAPTNRVPHPLAGRWVVWSWLSLASTCLAGCTPDSSLEIARPGSLSAPSGRGSFRLGAATAAAQIEDQNPNTDFYVFSQPVNEGGLGNGRDFVGDAIQGYTRALDDVQLIRDMHLDAYRFSIEWARVEPRRDEIDEAALAHYGALLDALVAAGIRPMVTIHHFSSPTWISDPRDLDCASGPSDTNLCGLGHPVGGPQIVEEFGEFAQLLAERFGDRVDEWCTENEPMLYLFAAYGGGAFAPGHLFLYDLQRFGSAVRDYGAAHVAMYDAVHAHDAVDADGDGETASVGFSMATIRYQAAQSNTTSEFTEDLDAEANANDFNFHRYVDTIVEGQFDGSTWGLPDESHPEWAGKLDWLGIQYYTRLGVTGTPALIPGMNATPCFPGDLDAGACLPPADPTFCVDVLGFEFWAPGLYDILERASTRWPDVPLVVTEGGISTRNPERRTENIVRSLEQIDRALRAGIDVRGYYHWSLMDNWEWMHGYAPKFGLYSVDRTTYARTATSASVAYGEIAASRRVSRAMRDRYGGLGPMTPEIGGSVLNGFGLCPTPE